MSASVAARPCREQAEGQQQRQCAEARHQDVDVSRPPIVCIMMVREHERPRRDGLEFPGKQETEAIGGKHDEIHAGKEQGIDGEHPAWCGLVPPMTDGKQAGASTSQVDHQNKECRERVQAKIGAAPG
jgi:hypothetical protein